VLLLSVCALSLALSWSETTLSQARFGLSGACTSNSALFAGGYNQTASAAVDIFHLSNLSWTVATLSVPRYFFAAASDGSTAVFAGGNTNDYRAVISAAVDIYSAGTGSWSTANLSSPRQFLAATSVGTLLYFAGGQDSTQACLDTVDVYDTLRMVWNVTTPGLSLRRAGLAAASAGGLAVFAGGFPGPQQFVWTDVVDIYNVSGNSWTTATLSLARGFAAAAAAGPIVLFAGGEVGQYTGASTVDFFNTSAGQWLSYTLSSPRFLIAGASLGGRAYFAGGHNGTGLFATYYTTVDIYDSSVAGGSWSLSTLAVARDSFAACSVGAYLVLFAGGVGSQDVILDTVDILDATAAATPAASTSPVSTATASPTSLSPTPLTSALATGTLQVSTSSPPLSPSPPPPTPSPASPSVCCCRMPPPLSSARCNATTGQWVVPSLSNNVTLVLSSPTLVNGSFQQQSGGVLQLTALQMPPNSTVPAPLQVTGCASLAGTLVLSIQLQQQETVPAGGWNVTVLQSPCITGQFSNVTLLLQQATPASTCVPEVRDQYLSGSNLLVFVQLPSACASRTPVVVIAAAVGAVLFILVVAALVAGYFCFMRYRHSRLFDGSSYRYHAM
jgi:hypothetical protein